MRATLLLLLISPIFIFCQEEVSSNKTFHFGLGVSPIINFHYSAPKVGTDIINSMLIQQQYQGDPYNFLAQYEGHSYVSLISFLRWDMSTIGTNSSISINSPIELGFSKWIVGSAHGVMQAAAANIFDSQVGYGHISLPVYLGYNYGLGSNHQTTSKRGFGLSLGVENVIAPLYLFSETSNDAFPELNRAWTHPSAMINFNILDRNNRLFTVLIKGSRGLPVKAILFRSEEGSYNSQTYSISVIRMFGF